MNGMKKVLSVILCALIGISMAACTDDPSGSVDTGGMSSAVSQQPETVSTEEPSEFSAVSETALPESSVVSEISEEPSAPMEPAAQSTEKLQTITVGSSEFQEMFRQNPTDDQFSADFDAATSNALLGDVIYDATEYWKQMVAAAYDAALASAETEERREEVKTAYQNAIETLQLGLSEASILAENDVIAGALATMNHYRVCAAELCNLYYENTGTLPSFDLTETGGAAG